MQALFRLLLVLLCLGGCKQCPEFDVSQPAPAQHLTPVIANSWTILEVEPDDHVEYTILAVKPRDHIEYTILNPFSSSYR